MRANDLYESLSVQLGGRREMSDVERVEREDIVVSGAGRRAWSAVADLAEIVDALLHVR